MVRVDLPAPLATTRVLAILRGHDTATACATVDVLAAAGITAVEVTLDSPGALATIGALAADPALLVGAGTVRRLDDAKRAVDAGAALLVSPHTDVRVVEWCADEEVPYLPGALTPTEVWQAWSAGACAVKLFPAGAVGPRYLRELRAPMRDVRFVPTGGVTGETAAQWLSAGAAAVAVGGWLTGDPALVPPRAAALVAAVAGADAAAAGENVAGENVARDTAVWERSSGGTGS